VFCWQGKCDSGSS